MSTQFSLREAGPAPQSHKAGPTTPPGRPMLTPANARRILCRSTGGDISRTTFYRWLHSGKLRSIRLGFRIYIPWDAVDDLIKQCMAGERF